MTDVLCIYHGNCVDGFASAWTVRKLYSDLGHLDMVTFHAGVYQEPPPDPTGKVVLIVDFSYKREMMKMICGVAKEVTVIDHHKTAIEDLAGLDTECPNLKLVFDLERSGAGLTWDTLFQYNERPDLINTIEDRDLWKFSIDKTREVSAALFSYPYDFAVWDDLMEMADTLSGFNQLAREGEAIERKHFKDIAELLKVCQRKCTIVAGDTEWRNVPVASLPYTMSSDAGNIMAKSAPFAACYSDTAKGRVFSLRSDKNNPDAVDVSAVASVYGGGGHKHAAGFTVPRDHPLAQF